MRENTVTGKLLSGGDPQGISREIITALAESGRFGYDVHFEESVDEAGELTITFRLSAAQQAIVVKDWAWRYRGGITQAVIDGLTM